jgi:hypothetical protein
MYFADANNDSESATRPEEEFAIKHTVCSGRTTRCIRVSKNLVKPTSEIVFETI